VDRDDGRGRKQQRDGGRDEHASRSSHDGARESRPEAFPGRASARLKPARSEHGQEDRLERQRRNDRDERHEQPGDAHRADERNRDQQEQAEADRDGRPGEDHRSARGRHRARDRLVPPEPAAELLTEAVDDEQRVVDREAEPDQGDEVRDVRRGLEQLGDAEDRGQRAGDRARREQEGDRHRERRAEEDEQNEERDRHRDQLAPPAVGAEDRPEVVLDRGLAGDEGLLSACGAQPPPEVVRVRGRVVQVEPRRDVAVEDPAAAAELSRLAGRNGLGSDGESACQTPSQDRLGGLPRAEDDDERPLGALVEVPREQRPRALGLGARHAERGRQQPRQPGRGGDAHGEDGRPAREDGEAAAQDGGRPALVHHAQRTSTPERAEPRVRVWTRPGSVAAPM
jgi:hypothetical protein